MVNRISKLALRTRVMVMIVLAMFMTCGSCVMATPRKVATTLKAPDRKKVKRKRVPDRSKIIVSGPDSMYWAGNIVFMGFDKQPNSSVESFHVSNGTEKAIKDFEIEITYTDLKGRMLHRRKETVKESVPPGETRKIDIKSFDTQHSFYYRLSNAPKRAATPFDVHIRLLSLHLLQD